MKKITFCNGPEFKKGLKVIKSLYKDKKTLVSTNGYPLQSIIVKELNDKKLNDVAKQIEEMTYYELEDFFINNIDE